MRRSHAAASERPAPAVGPLTAAITGFSSARIARMFGWYVLPSRSPDVVRDLAELGEVLAGAEAAARARDHDGANLGVGGIAEAPRQRGVQRGVERVEHLGAVERDRQHRAVTCRLDLGHQRP